MTIAVAGVKLHTPHKGDCVGSEMCSQFAFSAPKTRNFGNE